MALFLKNISSVAAVAILLGLGFAPASLAATANVSVGSAGLVYTPATSNIAVGDRVIWTWGGLNHSTTSDTALWDSGVANSPHTFTNQFNSAGTFPYHCTFHVSFGMVGSIIVTAPNSPPSVTITNPVTGTVFIAPANVTIQASASDTDGTVTNVQFRIGSTILTNKPSAPFFAVTNNLAAGSYTLSAIASDNLGAKTTNSVNIIVDTPPSVTITNPASGAVLSAPANVLIQASATDPDGSVTNVQFLLGATVLTNQPAAPFSASTNNLPAGSYMFSAIAADNNGIKATNSVTISIVTPVAVTLNASQRLSATNFQFSYPANIGLNYVVQCATNLLSPNWIPVLTNTAASNPVVFVDNHSTNNPGFYRVGRLPNP
jgi:plastocyanin